MIGIFDRLTWVQRLTAGLLAMTAGVVVILEGVSAESATGAIGIVLCGLVPVAALLSSTVSATVVSGIAVLSIVFTVICAHLQFPPDNTFGVIELLGLATLMVRVIIQVSPRRAVWLAALLFIAAPLLPLRLADQEYRSLIGAAIVFGMAFMALLGMYLRLHDRRRADAFDLARQSQRLEYARDLHDFVAHHVTAMVAQAQAVRFITAAGMAPSPEGLDEMLAGIEKAGSEALVSMRGMVTVLRDDTTAPVRPHQTLGPIVADAADRYTGSPVTTSIDQTLATRTLSPKTLDAARHVVQESLTNVLRHAAEVTRVEISAHDSGESVELSVTNDGIAASNGLPGGFGLVGLTERVESVGGRLSAGPTGTGWAVTAVLPSSQG
ncbi:hypothetical protein CFN78_18040 [Amycolatopsis antarctica]|uniref:histidine kinase n=1 Tax=Amycolatopsis antarctica TaxID=1854586 RepID=A0A263CZY1_9PSEU|nr:histidine kinase [Amycolatopsis antarctica]OZM71733.1 hypothetical protein CFN78_18040 [Amycolatopsis antarctica]